MREMRLKIVVFPAPFGPMIVNTSPCSTSKLTPSTALIPPKLIPRPSALKNVRGPPMRSSQALRAHVRLLAPERRVLVEREEREVDLDLHPPTVDAERLEEDEQHEDQTEDPGLQSR